MKKTIYITLLTLLGSFSKASAQNTYFQDLCLSIDQIDPNGYNLFLNDAPYATQGQFPFLITMGECWSLVEDLMYFQPNEACCDTFIVEYGYPESQDKYIINLVIKCDEVAPKPNCTNIYLNPPDTHGDGTDPSQNEKITYYACDESPVTYFVDQAPGQITWDTGTIPFTQIQDHEIEIIWPPAGSYTITATVGTVSTMYCIEVLDSPIADFTFSGSCGCLNTPISFMSTGTGGNEFYWDFGDGTIDFGQNVTHEYSTPGQYIVELIVIQDNFDNEMNPLCCCTDTITMPIEILNLEGPPIYCISTLCENDSTKYWTDAVGCTYSWTAVDANGVNVLPSGAITSNDTLCVAWGDGPFGEVSLTVSGCPNYCNKPTTVVIPIIEQVSTISGKDTVCNPSIEFYTVPKWPTVEYDWEIIPNSAGTFSGNGTNSISVSWNGTATSATIVVNYWSDFLGGIAGHEPENCSGYAELEVTILPKFELKSPTDNKFCIGEPITFEAGPVLPSTVYPLFFTWEVDPPSGPNTSTMLAGNAPWNTSFTDPGTYYVSVYPTVLNPYCNDTIVKKIEIVEVPPMDMITGPKEVCEGDTAVYFGVSSTPATQFHWVALGGSIVGPNFGNPVTVDWNSSGPYQVIAYQQQIFDPQCASDTISCTVEKKTLGTGYTISGPSACTNEIMTYNISPVPSDPDVSYSWEIMSSLNGSVVDGDTGPVVDIQWNNTLGVDTIFCTIALCTDTLVLSKIVTINEADTVVITQNMDYCIGALGVTLTASTSGAMSYNWSTPSPPPVNTTSQSVNVTAPGNYVVTVTETNGCTAVANYEVFENGLPNVNLTSPDILGLCIQDAPNTVDLHALVGSYSYQWFKSDNGLPYATLPNTTPVITHTNSGTTGYCIYYYIATDINTLCSSQSNTVIVTQDSCVMDTMPCIPQPFTTNLTSSPDYPECNVIDFTTSNSGNVTITAWNFGDPNSNGYTGPINSPTHKYTEAGYYVVFMSGQVPNDDNTGTCSVSDTTAVCIPLVADFDYSYDCGEYTFTSTSSWVSGADPTLYSWNFGDGGSASGPPPAFTSVSHMYNVTTTTSFPVTLTISNLDGCVVDTTFSVLVNPPPTADIQIMPPDTCIKKPFMFSNTNNTGIVGWNWEFGDMSTNGGDSPKHAYNTAGTYMITLTVTDENGCTGTDVESLIVHPAAVTGPITYTGDLNLCLGESLILNAPAGDQYIWNTGSTTASILVTMAGTYGVTVTDINGCTFVPDSVDVIVYPPIDATISGNTVICDEGCTTLFAVGAAGYSYQWSSNIGPLAANPGGTSVTICYDALNTIMDVTLDITDGNNCPASNNVPIDYFDSPDVLITPSDPILCAGTPNTLTASTTYPNPVVFDWGANGMGPSINVILEGTYTVKVTDPVTGCSSNASIIVNPIPDLCIIPYGCYTACDPDTLCAPDGLIAYEWYYQGILQPMYSGMQCIIVTQSGAYNFAGTNQFNCEAISDTLHLELIPCCRPGDTDISAFVPAGQTDCCYSFNYSLNQDIFYALDLRSDDADLALDPGSVNPLLDVTSSLVTLNSFENDISGTPLPQGPLSGFATICLENASNNPVEVIADWRGEDGVILCSDTLLLECLVEPDCIYVQNDTIYCDADGNVVYDVTICNPVDASYEIGFIDFLELSPSGVMLSPSEIDLTSNPLMPGDCIDLSLFVLGSGIANQDLCFNLVGHQYNPNEDPGSLCCSVDTTYCIFIPGCSPCDMVYVSGIDTSSMGECCYDVTVNNYLLGVNFTGINLCVLSGGATFDIFNPMNSPWDITTLTTTTANLEYSIGGVTTIPMGDTQLPTICVGDNDTPFVDIEIKWMSGNDVVCRDTISLLCPGDCGYMSQTSLMCGPNGDWIFTGYITNTSSEVMDNAFIDFGADVLNAYDTNINLNGLLPGDTLGPISIVLDGSTGAGPELCIITTLHANDHNDNHEECCQFKTVIEVPDCELPVDCNCGPAFEDQVALGMDCNPVGQSTYEFSPAGNFGECDQVIWQWIDEQLASTTIGNQSITHTFPGPGDYTVCMIIVRTQPDGKQCKEKVCKDVLIIEEGFVSTYPNPVTNQINLILKETSFEGMAKVEIMDANNRKCKSVEMMMSSNHVSSIQVDNMKTGIYILRIDLNGKIHTKRILILE